MADFRGCRDQTARQEDEQDDPECLPRARRAFPQGEVGEQGERQEHQEVEDLVLLHSQDLAVDLGQVSEMPEAEDGQGNDIEDHQDPEQDDGAAFHLTRLACR